MSPDSLEPHLQSGTGSQAAEGFRDEGVNRLSARKGEVMKARPIALLGSGMFSPRVEIRMVAQDGGLGW